MATTTYFFDGHIGISDPGSNWTNDANAFDGSTATSATPTAASSVSSLYLYGQGTTAPASGLVISSVTARLYGTSSTLGKKTRGTIFTSSLAEQLGQATSGSNSTTGFGTDVVLTPPAAGWSWSAIQSLEVKVFSDDAVAAAYRVEFDVSSSHNAPGNYGRYVQVPDGMSRSEVAN